MTWPKGVTKKKFPDFDKQLQKVRKRFDEEEEKKAQRKIDILTGKRIGPEPVDDDDEEYWQYRADRFHEDDMPEENKDGD